MTRTTIVLLAVAAVSAAVTVGAQEDAMTSTFTATSPAFTHGTAIPPHYTADGADVNPELVLSSPPKGTAGFALIMDDPDAPMGTWVHWVAWSIPPDTRTIPEGALPAGAVEGRNSWGRTGYGGPAPPSGTHRYFFKVYALDATPNPPPSTDKAGLERAMKGHILAEAVLMGTYSRGR